MSLSIVNNMGAKNAHRQHNINVGILSKSQEKLNSGYRINRAADDAAGLSISEGMRRQIRGLNRGSKNIQDGISLIQTADGALSEVHDMLQRMNELSVQSANGIYSIEERAAIQDELNEIVIEINRVGSSTNFNGLKILDDAFGVEGGGSVTTLVKCPAADTGHLTEAYTKNGKYFAAAYLDFSSVNSKNITKLYNQGFSFNCSQGCNEVFDITFTNGIDSATNLSGKVHHKYNIDISGCANGTDLVNKIYSYVASNLPTNNSANPSDSYGDLLVSHSNNLAKVNGSTLVVYANAALSTEAAALNKFKNEKGKTGAIDCTSLTRKVVADLENEFNIQASSDVVNSIAVKTERMNASVLGIDTISVNTDTNAKSAIKSIKDGIIRLSEMRSRLGAYQNRLEHAYDNDKNAEENIQAAESRIRDTDMVEEMMHYRASDVTRSVSEKMITQANQQHEGIVTLLQQ